MKTNRFIKSGSLSSVGKGLMKQTSLRAKEKGWMAKTQLGQKKSMNSDYEPKRASYYGLRGRKNISLGSWKISYDGDVNMTPSDDCS